ncbi:sialidase family protein [Tautonia marina]|uniref:sialidase family protein n=1 Tax=Tautonia marina TaxID=2653855 RepID=UPI0013761840|nr:sialidase family protein [Tautonia marina]
MNRRLLLAMALMGGIASTTGADEPFLELQEVFPPEQLHNHSSCIVECADGSLLVTWYRGSGERKADDVQIYGARKPVGAASWAPRFVMADTPDYPDCNPVAFVPPDGSLWLFYPTILDHHWEGALLKYHVSDRSEGEGPPSWSKSGVLHVTPTGFGEAYQAAMARIDELGLQVKPELVALMNERADDELYQRLGWMPRVRPLVLPTGRWLLPLYTDTFSASIVAISDDNGGSWRFSSPMIGYGNIQPALVRREDGTIVAYMRNNGPGESVCVSESRDDGETWSPVERSNIPNPGTSVDAIRLESGRWALVFNDTVKGRHSLAIALSDDEGKTWSHVRHLAVDPDETQAFHYPTVLQARDGSIHVSYTHGRRPEGSTIVHAKLNEAWVMEGDAPQTSP